MADRQTNRASRQISQEGAESDADSMASVASKRSRRMSVTSHSSRSPATRCPSVTLSKDVPLGDEEEAVSFTGMSREKKFTLVTFCLTNFCVGAFYSLLAPFFPTEAAKKGVSNTVIGLIFGCFELVLFLTAPIFGSIIGKVGGKFMYITGLMVCGTSAVLFGFLDMCPPGTIYIVMCFLVRFFEALGAAAFSTASFAILAYTFPNNVATMFGSLELFSGFGLMVGPPLGGALFTAGGFKLPFITLGAIILLVGLVSIFLLPSPTNLEHHSSKNSIFTLLRIPLVAIMCLCLFAGATAIGFLDVTLSIYLQEKYNFTPLILGVVFLVGPGVYALTAPLWGYVGDRWPKHSCTVIVVGYLIGGSGFILMGPAPFLPLSDDLLWLMLVGLGMMGFGIGTLVIGFQVITEAARADGLPDTLETFGLISGVFNSFFSLGAFVGPLAGGYMNDAIQFAWSTVVIGVLSYFAAFVLFIQIVISPFCVRRRVNSELTFESSSIGERQPLLASRADQPDTVSYDRQSRVIHITATD